MLVFKVFALFPNFFSETFGQEGVCTGGEVGHTIYLTGAHEMFTHHSAVEVSFDNNRLHKLFS